MKYKALAVSLAVAALSGCGDSDTELPSVSSDTLYSCGDFVHAASRNDRQQLEGIVAESFSIFDKEFTEDTRIQQFYRAQIRKSSIYSVKTGQVVKEICSVSASKPYTEAAIEAINQVYAWSLQSVENTTCQAYLDETFTFDDVLGVVNDPTKNAENLGRIRVLLNNDIYGFTSESLRANLDRYCSNSPQAVLISSVYNSSSSDFSEAVLADQRRQNEQQQASYNNYRNTKIEQYAKNLLDSEETNNCDTYFELHSLYERGDDDKRVKNAIIETLNSVAEALPPHQKLVFDQLLEDSAMNVADDMRRICSNVRMSTTLQEVAGMFNEVRFAEDSEASPEQ